MALAQISVIPIGTPSASIGDWIAESVKVLEGEDIRYEISPTGTLIEGSTEDIFRIAGSMHSAALSMGIERVFTTLVIDDRRDKEVTMESKVESVRKRLS